MKKPVKNTSCFSEHTKADKVCRKKDCRFWIDCKNNLNCGIISSQKGPKTLQEIGDIFGLTRMRICQIEKVAVKKLREKISTMI